MGSPPWEALKPPRGAGPYRRQLAAGGTRSAPIRVLLGEARNALPRSQRATSFFATKEGTPPLQRHQIQAGVFAPSGVSGSASRVVESRSQGAVASPTTWASRPLEALAYDPWKRRAETLYRATTANEPLRSSDGEASRAVSDRLF